MNLHVKSMFRRLCRLGVAVAVAATFVALFSLPIYGVTLRLWNFNVNAEVRDWYQSVFKPAFEAEYPDVTLDLLFPSQYTYYDQLLVAIASGVAPDVCTSNNALFYTEGLVIDLNDLVASWPVAQEMFPPVLNMLSHQGHLYGIPLAIAPRTMVVNTRILAEGGYDPQNPPYTWDDIARAIPRLNRWNAERTVLEQVGMHVELLDIGAVHGFIYTNGGEIMNPDGTAAFNSAEGVEALDFWTQLYAQHLPSHISKPTFVQGKAAMVAYNNPSVFINIARTNMDLLNDIAVAPQPVTNKRSAVLLMGAPIGITTASKHKDLAWELLKFHFRPDMSSQYNELFGQIPPIRTALSSGIMRSAPWIGAYLNLTEKFGVPSWAFQSTVFQLVRGYLADAAAAAYKGTMPAKQALDEAARLWNQVLGEQTQ
ncbi:MAG TPA: sugar ABC transporter substrate-binding protein [Firmicutes bacterium]|nr:sugar ABC transporter substrate-binding protein [Bacillota bacterium]